MRSTLLTAVLVFATTTASQAGETLDRVKRTGVLQDVLVDDYPPFGFIDANNRLAGFDVDVAQAIATKLGGEAQTVDARLGNHLRGALAWALGHLYLLDEPHSRARPGVGLPGAVLQLARRTGHQQG